MDIAQTPAKKDVTNSLLIAFSHVLQSDEWMIFKNSYGTEAVKAGGLIYTKHRIPLSSHYFAYSPRISPEKLNFTEIKESLRTNNCIALHLDVPNVIEGSTAGEVARGILSKECEVSKRDEFARGNFLLDLTRDLSTILAEMYHKHRYNIKVAEKKGLDVRVVSPEDADCSEQLGIFTKLYSDTARRQKYFGRSPRYFRKIWDAFAPTKKIYLINVSYQGTPLASWMLFHHEDVLYYPYGGSSEEHRNLQASCLIGWEAIKLGKKLNCKLFDMWGASYDMQDTTDPYYGFSQFKEKFGATHVKYINSYDLILDPIFYKGFTLANNFRWMLLSFLR